MIGVIANPSEHDVVCEFFELFKTPWEFYRTDQRYDVVLCAGGDRRDIADQVAKIFLLYSGRRIPSDGGQKIHVKSNQTGFCTLFYGGNRIPIYGEMITFPDKGRGVLTDEGSQQPAAYLDQSEGRVLTRIGYDLFAEVRKLLTVGQPVANAGIPALELHIGFLRDLITQCGVRLLEIPPIPDGHPFIACLTHDVDHPSIRSHKWDRTMFGFLYRAVFGSVVKLLRGRMSLRNLFTNWAAALKLPFVYIGVAKDFWRDFDGRYRELEKGLCSTFFVIPFKNCPGRKSHGDVPRFRAARYGATDLADTIRRLMVTGSEVGLHGIDAWRDAVDGRAEVEEIQRITGISTIGVRMHWLYYDHQSPTALEKAGAAYDSTNGYNETVGYRAGTTQVYKPLGAMRLLELPLHVMDTALYYPAYLGLSPSEAKRVLDRMVTDGSTYGGCLTVNWHDRSLAPERLWNVSYRDLVQEMKDRGAWFATAGQAISWFQKRRSAVFETDCAEPNAVRCRVSADNSDQLPSLRLRIHNARDSCGSGAEGSERYVDMLVDDSVDARVPCVASC